MHFIEVSVWPNMPITPVNMVKHIRATDGSIRYVYRYFATNVSDLIKHFIIWPYVDLNVGDVYLSAIKLESVC